MKDFKALRLNTPAKYMESEPCDPSDLFGDCYGQYDSVEPILTRFSGFENCFQMVKNISKTEDRHEYWESQPYADQVPFKSPCNDLNNFPDCSDYCKWHKDFVTKTSKDQLLTMMKYAQPQKMVRTTSEKEEELGKRLFGESKVKSRNREFLSSYPFAVYCYQKDEGFSGLDIGLSAKVCNDFALTPTDSGMCMTKNLDIKALLDDAIVTTYDQIFDSGQRSKKRIKTGSMWGEVSILFLTTRKDIQRRTHTSRDEDSVKLQLHQAKEFAHMNIPDHYDLNHIPIKLDNNHEYYIKVTPTGKVSSEGLRSMLINQRECKLDEEVSDESIFKTYTKSNCQYDCHVKLSIELCQCSPWDFLHKVNGNECDVFGRTCFYNSIKNLSQYHVDLCPQCKRECDYVEFKKEMISSNEINSEGSYYTSVSSEYLYCSSTDCRNNSNSRKEFLEYFYDLNNTITSKEYQNMFEAFKEPKTYAHFRATHIFNDAIIIHLKFMKPEIDFIDVKYTTMDKLATFGGNFGIFEMISGWSLFGILNLILMICKWFFGFNKN